MVRGCGLGEEVAAGDVARERKWLQGVWLGRGSGCRGCGLEEAVTAGVWPGRGSDCRGVAWERESLKNGTMEGDREGRFERREQLASFSGSPSTHQPHSPQYHTASDGRLGG